MDFKEFKKKYQKVEVFEFPNNVMKAVPEPEISIRVTTYQHKHFIIDALEGILMQKINVPYEIIIGDDESSDGTREICIEYAKKYPNKIRLFLHKRENNIAIMGKPCLIFQYTYNSFNLRGKFVAGCSGDDYWTDPYKIQKQYDFLKQNPAYSACFHRFYILREKSTKKNEQDSYMFYPDEQVQKSIRPLTLMYRNIYNELPEQFVEVLAEDTFIRFILSTKGKFKYMKKIEGAVYREHEESVWNSTTRLFKFNESVFSKTKILDAYRNTKYQRICEKHLIVTLFHRRFYIKEEENAGLILTVTDFFKEVKDYHLPNSAYLSLLKHIINKQISAMLT